MALKILLVDDNGRDRKLMRAMLIREQALAGYDLAFDEASDGKEALDLFAREHHHLVITDLLMPRADGFALCGDIRRRLDGRDTPLIAVSGVYKDQETTRKLQEERRAAVLAKPLDPRLLTSTILEQLRAYQSSHPEVSAKWIKVDDAPKPPAKKPTRGVPRLKGDKGDLASRARKRATASLLKRASGPLKRGGSDRLKKKTTDVTPIDKEGGGLLKKRTTDVSPIAADESGGRLKKRTTDVGPIAADESGGRLKKRTTDVGPIEEERSGGRLKKRTTDVGPIAADERGGGRLKKRTTDVGPIEEERGGGRLKKQGSGPIKDRGSSGLRRTDPSSVTTLDFDRPGRGNLNETPLSWLLVQCAALGASGTFKLLRGKIRKVVYVLEGSPIYVDSNLRSEALGAYLVANKIIDEAQLALGLKHAKASSLKLGEALIDLGYTDERSILDGLQAQVQIKLARALMWSDGTFTFLPGDSFRSRVPNCKVESVELILAVLKKVRRADEELRLDAPMEQALELTGEGERYRAQIEEVFDPGLLQLVISGSSLSAVLRGGQDRTDTLLLIDVLQIAGLGRTVEREEPDEGVEPERDHHKRDTGPQAMARITTVKKRISIGADSPPPAPAAAPGPAAGDADAPPEPADSLEAGAPLELVDLSEPAPLYDCEAPDDIEKEFSPLEKGGAALETPPGKTINVRKDVLDLKHLASADRGVRIPEVPSPPALELFEPGEENSPSYLEPEDSGVFDVSKEYPDLELDAPARLDTGRLAAPSVAPVPEVAATSEHPAQPSGDDGDSPDPAPPAALPPAAANPRESLLKVYLGIHGKSYYEVLEVERAASDDALEAARLTLLDRFATGKFVGVDLGDDEDKLIELSLIIEQAYAVLSDPVRRRAYDAELVGEEEEASTEHSDPISAELHFQTGQVLLKRNALANAVTSFKSAVEEDPDQPDYHATLAWALFLREGRGEKGAAAARPHLDQALSIAVDSVKAHEIAGWVARDAGDLDRAVEHLSQALKLGHHRDDIVDALKDMLHGLERYEELEHLYRRLIFRLREIDPAGTVPLWMDLYHLYRQKLEQPENARVALGVVGKLAPNDPRVQAALNTTADSSSRTDWRAVAEGHRRQYLSQPDDLTPLHELVRLHRSEDRADQLLTALELLVHLDGASEDERRTLDELIAARPVAREARLTPELLQRLRHPDDLELVEALVSLLSPVMSDYFPVSNALQEGGERLEAEDLPGHVAAVVTGVADRLQVPMPGVCFLEAESREAILLPMEEDVLVVSGALREGKAVNLQFAAARALSCFSAGRRQIFGRSGTELKVAVLATLSLCRPASNLPDPDGQIRRFREALESCDIPGEDLAAQLDQLLSQGTKINLSQWMRAVRFTSTRVALMICSDLVAALDMLDDDLTSKMDIIEFVLSQEYADLREVFDSAG